MGYSIIFITEKKDKVLDFFQEKSNMVFEKEKAGVLHFGSSDDNSFMTIMEINISDYSVKDLDYFKNEMESPKPYLIDTNDFLKVINLIGILPKETPIILDNDNGVFMGKDIFLKLKTFDDFFHYKETEELS